MSVTESEHEWVRAVAATFLAGLTSRSIRVTSALRRLTRYWNQFAVRYQVPERMGDNSHERPSRREKNLYALR